MFFHKQKVQAIPQIQRDFVLLQLFKTVLRVKTYVLNKKQHLKKIEWQQSDKIKYRNLLRES